MLPCERRFSPLDSLSRWSIGRLFPLCGLKRAQPRANQSVDESTREVPEGSWLIQERSADFPVRSNVNEKGRCRIFRSFRTFQACCGLESPRSCACDGVHTMG